MVDRYEDPGKIHHYTYGSENHSLVDRYVLKYWWKLTIHLIPKRMPANLVSMLGNLGSWFSFLVLSGILFGPVPEIHADKPWVFALAAFGLLLYQTFDALDGIQARRTGLSGPLGEYVDHFFDSFNVFLLPLGLCIAFQVPTWFCLFAVYLGTFFDWIELRRVKETGKLHFGALSSEEAQVLLIVFYAVLSFGGYDLCVKPIAGLGLSPVMIALFIATPVGIAMGIEPLATHRFKWLGEVATEAVTLAPVAAWALVAAPRYGLPALILGTLLLGFSGSRYAGDLLRSRLFGLKDPRWYPDMLVLDAILLVSLFLPSLPSWLPLAVAGAYLAWLLACLGLQFRRAVARVRECLGTRLFGAPQEGRTTTG